MSEKKFSKKHEWVSLEGEVATVGITKHATEERASRCVGEGVEVLWLRRGRPAGEY